MSERHLYVVPDATPTHTPAETVPAWMGYAECRGVNVDLFFPVDRGHHSEVLYRDARQVCARCDVAGDCLDWAVTHFEHHGMWGGMTPHERKQLRRKQLRQQRRQQ